MSFLVACAVLFVSSHADDVRTHLEALRAAKASERSQAQRWLARHVREDDLPLLREAARAGDAEVRRRLELALADDDAHVGLCVRLAMDTEAHAAEVGRAGLRERILRWSPAWGQAPKDRSAVLPALPEGLDRPVGLDPRTKDARLDVALDQLARYGRGPVLVLDPDLAVSDHPREPVTRIEGTFGRVLDELVRAHRADFEAFALEEEPRDPAARPWIRVKRSVDAERRTGVDCVVGWCLGFAAEGDPARRGACARALASTAWPGGIAWLARIWNAGDETALEGLLHAAGRGQVAPSLAVPEKQRALYARMASLARERSGSWRADEIARALAAAGPRGLQGEDLAAIAIESLGSLSPREQWLRLVVIEGMRPTSPPVARALDSLLQAKGTQPSVAFQALRARAATVPRAEAPIVLPDAHSVLRAGELVGDDGVRVFLEVGVETVTVELTEPGGNGRPWALLDRARWFLFAGETEAAARTLSKLVARGDGGAIGLEAISERTSRWVRDGARPIFEESVAAARALPHVDRERLDRLEVLSGAGSPELRARWLETWTRAARTREELFGLASLVVEPGGEEPRSALIRALADPALRDDAIDALARAGDGLRAARRKGALLELITALRKATREGPPDLRSRLRLDAWPPPPPRELLDLDREDRALERSGL